MATQYDKLMQLAATIEQSPSYDQTMYFHLDTMGTCKTPSCIAGHACVLFDDKTHWFYDDPSSYAAHLLDLTASQAKELFQAHPYANNPAYAFGEFPKATREEAAKVLRHLAITGVVDWSICWR